MYTSKVQKSCVYIYIYILSFFFPFFKAVWPGMYFFSVALRIVILMNTYLVLLIKGKKRGSREYIYILCTSKVYE